MARFSLSFLAVFLVLAAFAISMPTKRDQSQVLGLDTALSELQVRMIQISSQPCILTLYIR